MTAPSGARFRFDIDPARKAKMLKGLDAIGETLQRAGDIDVFEQRQALAQPWLERGMTLIVAGTVRVPPENLDAPAPAHGWR